MSRKDCRYLKSTSHKKIRCFRIEEALVNRKNAHVNTLNQIIKCLNQSISENKPSNLRLCKYTFHKFQEKNLNLNRDSNSNPQIS